MLKFATKIVFLDKSDIRWAFVRLCQRVVWNLNNPCWLTLSDASMYESTLLCSPMLNESITYTQECLTFSLFVFLYRYESIFSDLMFPIGKQLLKQLHFLVDLTRQIGQQSKNKVSLSTWRREMWEFNKACASLRPPFEFMEYQSREWQPSFTGRCMWIWKEFVRLISRNATVNKKKELAV